MFMFLFTCRMLRFGGADVTMVELVYLVVELEDLEVLVDLDK